MHTVYKYTPQRQSSICENLAIFLKEAIIAVNKIKNNLRFAHKSLKAGVLNDNVIELPSFFTEKGIMIWQEVLQEI